MYVPAHFSLADATEAAAFIVAHPFALVCVNGLDGPVAAHVPLVAELDASGTLSGLLGHVARANPIWQLVGEGCPVLAVFHGPDAYVSPSAYASKAVHGKVVPTWNYIAAQVRGVMTIETDPAKMDPYITAPTNMMEQDRAKPWATSDAPESYIEAMKRAIVGVQISVTDVAVSKKLSQNKDHADYHGVANDLLSRPDPAARAIGETMILERAKP